MTELKASIVLSRDDIAEARVLTPECGHPFVLFADDFAIQAEPGENLPALLRMLADLIDTAI